MTAAWLDLFARPLAGLGLLLVPALAWQLAARGRRSAARLRAVVGRRTAALCGERSSRRGRLRVWLATAGVAACVLSWMQPRIAGRQPGSVESAADLCLCLDVSRSMLARDCEPSRLGFARAAIAALAKRTRGDRMALVEFAGEARLRVPMTRDVASLAELAQRADPIDVALGGTRLGPAIDASVAALAAAQDAGSDGPLRGAVLLITDGDDSAGAGRAAAARAHARGLRVHCVGIGSTLGSKITVSGANGRETFLRDRRGAEVVSRMGAAGLRALAAAGGGVFVDGSTSSSPLVDLYRHEVIPDAGVRRAGRQDGAGRRGNGYQVPLALGLLLLLLDCGLSRRRRGPGSAAHGGGP